MQPSDSSSAIGASFDAARLLAPISLDTFFADYWQKAALYVPKRSPDVFAGLYSCQDIERLLNLHHFQPARLQVLRSQDVSCGHSVALSAEGLVDLPKLYAEFNEGATLLVYNLHELSPAVARCCRAFEQVLQSPVEVTAVCTSRARDSSAPHYDPHDVFVVHLEGSKHWRIYDPFVTWPLRRHPLRYEEQVKKIALGKPLLELTVGPGDLLYVPRGLVHAIEVAEAPALHLSLAVAPLTWTDLLSALLTTGSAEHAPLREALPRNFSMAHRPKTTRARSCAACSPGLPIRRTSTRPRTSSPRASWNACARCRTTGCGSAKPRTR